MRVQKLTCKETGGNQIVIKTVLKIDGKYVRGLDFKDGKMVPWLTDNPKEIPTNQLAGPMMEGMIKQTMETNQKLEKEDIDL